MKKLHGNVQINSAGVWDREMELDCNMEQNPQGGWATNHECLNNLYKVSK